MSKKSDSNTALTWMTDLFNQLNISYQIVGGLAARCYGSTRPLYDIDVYVPGNVISSLENEFTEYIKFGPERYQDEHWDLVFIKLNYHGQQIEIGDADSARYFDSQNGQWVKEEIDFSDSHIIKLNGIDLPVMPKQDLITYKKRLDRDVDRIDIKEMQRQA